MFEDSVNLCEEDSEIEVRKKKKIGQERLLKEVGLKVKVIPAAETKRLALEKLAINAGNCLLPQMT